MDAGGGMSQAAADAKYQPQWLIQEVTPVNNQSILTGSPNGEHLAHPGAHGHDCNAHDWHANEPEDWAVLRVQHNWRRHSIDHRHEWRDCDEPAAAVGNR